MGFEGVAVEEVAVPERTLSTRKRGTLPIDTGRVPRSLGAGPNGQGWALCEGGWLCQGVQTHGPFVRTGGHLQTLTCH